MKPKGRNLEKMITNISNIDYKIKKTFRLFDGKRNIKEDKKLYQKLIDLCFDEVIAFLEDNLSENAKENLVKELDNNGGIEVLLKYLQKIPNFKFKLDKRLDYFLNNLLYLTIKDK